MRPHFVFLTYGKHRSNAPKDRGPIGQAGRQERVVMNYSLSALRSACGAHIETPASPTDLRQASSSDCCRSPNIFIIV